MEKVLFIINSFGMGGAEKVLVDIAAALQNDFEVDVLVFRNRGPLKIEMEKHSRIFTLFTSSLHYLLFRKISLYRRHRINSFVCSNHYKAVVGFMEGKSTELVTDISVDVLKLAWVHSDFRKLHILLDTKRVRDVYEKMHKIVFVSGDAKNAFLERFPNIHSNLEVVYNIIDENSITQKSNAYGVERSKRFTFLNVGMHRKEKCQDRLIRIASQLKDLGYDFQIQLIGDGPLYSYLSELVTKAGVQDYVYLLGLQENPYPYIKACDCFVLPSDYEGYGIAVKEALFLKKLVLATNVVGPREILENGRFGLIVENDEESIFLMMRHILDLHRENRELEVMCNVREYVGDNEHIREQLKALFTT